MAKESIPFTKYPALHQLEYYHGVELGIHIAQQIQRKFSPITSQKASVRYFLMILRSASSLVSILMDLQMLEIGE